MTAARLVALDRLERRRRGRVGWLVPPALGLAAGAGLVALERTTGAPEARAWWLALALLGPVAICAGAPWRFFWRPDSTILARLPVPGRALYGLGAWRGARVGAGATIAIALAAVPWLVAGDAAGWLRAAAVGALASTCATALAPPVATLAGTIVASERAQHAVESLTGGGRAPSVIWLSFLPALAAFAVGVLVWLLAPFALRGELATAAGPAPIVAAAGLAGSLVALAAGARLAGGSLSAAVREVAALDAVKLAHVDLVGARGLEAAWGRAACGAGPAGAVYRKDVAIARRRHPGYYLLCGLAILALWAIAALAGEPTRARWGMGIALALAAYGALLGRRLAAPPIEHPRLLDVLPLPPGAPARAKRAYVAWRVLVPVALGAAPIVARAPDPLRLGALLAAIALAGLLLGAGLATRR